MLHPLSLLCHTDHSHFLCAAAKPPLQPPNKIKAPLEGEALLCWIPFHGGGHAHRFSLLLQITSAAETEAVTSQKLVKGHAYSVTGAEEVGELSQRGEMQRDLHVALPKLRQPQRQLQIDKFFGLIHFVKSGFESLLSKEILNWCVLGKHKLDFLGV